MFEIRIYSDKLSYRTHIEHVTAPNWTAAGWSMRKFLRTDSRGLRKEEKEEYAELI